MDWEQKLLHLIIFIVHGHNETSDVRCAIILMTADDKGKAIG